VDGGQTWRKLTDRPEGTLRNVAFASGSVAVAVGEAGAIYRTTDGGATWSALLTFNTSGNQIRHFHAVRYDRFTGDWYFVAGDNPLSAIIRWDGSSSAPPANTPLTPVGFAGYPGWEVMHDTAGFECRSGDLSVHPNSVYYMADNEDADTLQKYAFQISKQRYMQRIQSNAYVRTTGRAPLLQCELPNGAALWASMRGPLDVGAAPETFQGYDFWYTPDGVTFTRVARTRCNSAGTSGAIANMFMNNEGKLIISGVNAKGVKLLPSASNGGQGSIVCTFQAWDGVVKTLQGTA
jgi:hypothetical protein